MVGARLRQRVPESARDVSVVQRLRGETDCFFGGGAAAGRRLCRRRWDGLLAAAMAAAGRPYSRSSCVILQQRRGAKKKTCSEEEEEEPRIASAALGGKKRNVEDASMPGKGPRPHKTFLTATTQTKRLPLSSSPSPPRSVQPFPAFAFERVSHTLLHHASPLHGPYLRPRGLPPLQPGQGGSGGAATSTTATTTTNGLQDSSPPVNDIDGKVSFAIGSPLLLALDSALSCRGAGGESQKEELAAPNYSKGASTSSVCVFGKEKTCR